MVIVANQTPPECLAYLQKETIPYLVAGEERVNLKLALEKMKSLLGVACVMSTSPGKLGGALLRAGLMDEINILFIPAIVGGFDTPSLFESPELKPNEWPTRLKLISAQVLADGRVWLRYHVIPEQESSTKKAVKKKKEKNPAKYYCCCCFLLSIFSKIGFIFAFSALIFSLPRVCI